MPQMAPLNWLFLFFLFSFIFILFNILNYFCFTTAIPPSLIEKEGESKKNNFALAWKW